MKLTKISDPITWEELNKVLEYDPYTGEFMWMESRKKSALKGTRAGSVNGSGYEQIHLGTKLYLSHRLAWFYCFKEWPEHNIDHIDRVRSNNILDNLRDVTQSINIHNSISKPSKTGFRNARKVGNKYQSEIKVNGKSIHLGMFNTGEEASQAAKDYRKLNNLC